MAIKIQEPTLFLRVDKKKKDGRMPIYIRFQRIDGKEPKRFRYTASRGIESYKESNP